VVAVPVTQVTKERCPALQALRCDPGCHRPAHQAARAGVVDRPVRPRQGRRQGAVRNAQAALTAKRRRGPYRKAA
jgi:hypothetical protein